MREVATIQGEDADLKAARHRARRVVVEVLESYLPALIGALAETGLGDEGQAARIERLVVAFEAMEVVAQLQERGRPVLTTFDATGAGALKVNAALLMELYPPALADAFAPTLAQLLGLSPTLVSLLLRLRDDQQVRNLAGQAARHAAAKPVAATRIPALVRWRLARFEARHAGLIAGLSESASSFDTSGREPLMRALAAEPRWPEWFDVSEVPYLQNAVEAASTALQTTPWARHAGALTEMLWECGGVSPRSALRQAARTLRTIQGVDQARALRLVAEVLAEGAAPQSGELEAWPSFAELAQVWRDLLDQEARHLGSWRAASGQDLSLNVFDPPSEATGLSEPANLPWSTPLLCWSTRERDALRDLLRGMERALQGAAAPVRAGQLGARAFEKRAPLAQGERQPWRVGVPRRVPAATAEMEGAIDAAFAATRASMNARFASLSDAEKQRALSLAQGAYSGFLTRARQIWERRLASVRAGKAERAFDGLITEVARSLGLPLLIDVFESPAPNAPLAAMPVFCVPTIWSDQADFAPIWLPIEVIGESLATAPLRVRMVTLSQGALRWAGDHSVQPGELRKIPTERLLGSVYEGALMMTVHRRDIV
ncbi:hypothetical protein FRC98_17820 [Lujinxingia vulgaris]|uniref:Uncharacterized protein n=1 Tax=Lujinxingia vulgaris TaxID=2600176 RepID=A0A5C6XAC0_9DELT|nr:hypothetical protein [Lujinxingia vulgaris]TXD34978.1 hypothetical protein FRC98_17820 [Lujinxingia vulgaris]